MVTIFMLCFNICFIHGYKIAHVSSHSLISHSRISLPVLPFKYKYRITARYSTLDEKHVIASLAMFDIQYLIKDR